MPCSYSTSDFKQPWGLDLVGSPVAVQLEGGQLLVQFEIEWPGGETVPIMVGVGSYSGSGLSGIRKHSVYPQSATLNKNGVVTGL